MQQMKINDIFGKWKVLELIPGTKTKAPKCKCICLECGIEKILYRCNLYSGKSKGCPNCKKYKDNPWHDTRLYSIYRNMITRCENPNNHKYKSYGARGISICKEWRDNFKIFQKWALENGYNDELTIERKNVNGNYCPENCCWIPSEDQAKNKQNSIRINNKTIKEIAEEENKTPSCILWRYKNGYYD